MTNIIAICALCMMLVLSACVYARPLVDEATIYTPPVATPWDFEKQPTAFYTEGEGWSGYPEGFSVVQQDEEQVYQIRSEAGGYEVTVPMPVDFRGSAKNEVKFGQEVEVNTLFMPTNSAYWLVQYYNYPSKTLDSYSPSEILVEARDAALVDSRSSRVKTEYAVEIDEASGKHFTALSALRGAGYDGSYQARVYLVGQRVYRIASYTHDVNDCDCIDKVDGFLKSFRLIDLP